MGYNWGQGGMGAMSGAGAGSSFGPWGSLFGGLMGAMSGFGGGNTKDKTKQLPTMTPEQNKLLQQMMTMLSPEGQLGEGYGQSLDTLKDWLDPNGAAYQKFAQPYMNEFNQQTVPGLAERFAGMGGGEGGGLSSSGFGQSLSTAGANLQDQLAQLKTGLMGQAAQGLMGQYNQMSGQALGAKPFGYQHQQGGPGMGTQMFSQWAGSGFPGMQGMLDMFKGFGR